VKGVVGSATLAGVGTATSAMVNTTTNPTGAGGGITQYFGVERIAGPAPRSMPQIPVIIDDEGFLSGLWPEVSEKTVGGQTVTVAEEELAGITYSSEWFQYCGVQTSPGVRPGADQDNYFRYANNPPYTWQQEEVSSGDRMHVDDFADYETWGNDIGAAGIGKPAMGTWRSQDVTETMPIHVLRIPPDDWERISTESEQWLEAASERNFIAIMDKCTHFCCVPGFKTFRDSPKFNAEDKIYCVCHQSVYDQFSIVKESFVALPRPED
jgi:Rieske Fe-S protein